MTLTRQFGEGDGWRRVWIDGVDIGEPRFQGDYHLTQNRGIGLIAQGTEDWRVYSVNATMQIPLATSAGLAGFVIEEGNMVAGPVTISAL